MESLQELENKISFASVNFGLEVEMQTISIDINKVQKGDEAEFRLLFNLFYPRLMSVACRFVPEHIAEDIVQSAFCHVLGTEVYLDT